MNYNIEICDEAGGLTSFEISGEKKAMKLAREKAREYPDNKIFVSWYRSSDGQHGYLNSDGNHAITGEAW